MAQESASISEFSFVNDSEMGVLIRTFDWTTTTVGAVAGWSSSLKTAVSICLESAFPMLICWGTELVQFYNDAYSQILGRKHPQSLGQRMSDCWSEVWETLAPIVRSVQETSKAVKSVDTRFIIRRYGYEEEAYFSVSYSAIRDETDRIGGILCTVTETTERVLGDRRLGIRRELAVNTTLTRTVQEAGEVAINARKQAESALHRVQNELEQRMIELTRTNQALEKTLEELGVHEEELRLQNEELTVMRLTVENERQRYENLFNFAPDGYLLTDAHGNIQEANHVATVLLGLSQKSPVGRPLRLHVPKQEQQAYFSCDPESWKLSEFLALLSPFLAPDGYASSIAL